MDKETKILDYMKSLDISKEEAEQLWEDDQEDYIGEDGEEMTIKAKEVMRTIHGADSGKKALPKKNAPRERKENTEKREIIYKIQDLLVKEYGNAELTNIEKYISFKIGENDYEINLIQKRKPKKSGIS